MISSRLRLAALAASLCLLLCGCGGSKTNTDPPAPAAPAAIPAVSAPSAPETPEAPESADAEAFDPSSEEDMMRFLSGEWIFRSAEGDRDYATLKIAENGACHFEHLDGSRAFDGQFSVWPLRDDESALLSFDLSADAVPEVSGAMDAGYYRPENGDSVSGDFHIARGDGMDYLYLRMIGNGTTYLSDAVLQETFSPETYLTTSSEWLLVRPHIDGSVKRLDRCEDFFAFCWGRNENGELLLEKLQPEQYEDIDEFTNRRLIAGYFTDTLGLDLYTCPAALELDLSRLQSRSDFERAHPLRVYGVVTDDSGTVTGISELPALAYGACEFGELDPEFSYEGVTFMYNGSPYDLTDYEDSGVNAITDAVQVGSWIVVEGHINPHIAAYYCFNIDSGEFEKVLYGANLTWRNNDLTTAVYSAFSEIYGWKSELIGYVEDAEIMSLAFSSDGSAVEADCWRIEEGKEVTVQRSFELPPAGSDDQAMYRLIDYWRRPTAERWNTFMALAPEGANLFVIENPPSEFEHWLWNKMELDPASEDTLIAAALQDGTMLRIDEGEVLFEDDGLGWENARENYSAPLSRGDWLAFKVTIPEGIPSRCLSAESAEGTSRFLIGTISGEWPQCSTFVSAGETR